MMQRVIRRCCMLQNVRRMFCNTATDVQEKPGRDEYVKLFCALHRYRHRQ